MIASLPMYDWPEVQGDWDAYWSVLRDGLLARGMDAPTALTRSDAPDTHWQHPALVISQTCGWPYIRDLADDVALLGAFDFAATADDPPGHYHSVLIRRQGVQDAPRSFAYNETGSQSGYAALLNTLDIDGLTPIETGAHRASIRAVAEGRADIAAIDCVSWAYALCHEPAAAGVVVTGQSIPTPGLPLIAPLGADVAVMWDALLASVTSDAAHRLGITGFTPIRRADYETTVGIRP